MVEPILLLGLYITDLARDMPIGLWIVFGLAVAATGYLAFTIK